MSELEKAKENGNKDIGQDVITDLDTETQNDLPPVQPGLHERVRRLLSSVQQGGSGPRQELAKDRTRPLALLIGGTVGAVLLFIGVLSTPTAPPTQQPSGQAAPNLGRGAASSQPSTPRTSVTPLLNADVASNDGNSDQLSAADIQGTSRRASADDSSHSPEIRTGAGVPRAPSPAVRNSDGTSSSSSVGSDPLAAYRLNNTGTPTYSYGGLSPAAAELSRTYGGAPAITAESRPDVPVSAKSSIVFLRSSVGRCSWAKTLLPQHGIVEQPPL